MVIQESGDNEQALKHLDKYRYQICDRVTLKETYGRLFLVATIRRYRIYIVFIYI